MIVLSWRKEVSDDWSKNFVLQLLREIATWGQKAHCWTDGIHLRRMRTALRNHPHRRIQISWNTRRSKDIWERDVERSSRATSLLLRGTGPAGRSGKDQRSIHCPWYLHHHDAWDRRTAACLDSASTWEADRGVSNTYRKRGSRGAETDRTSSSSIGNPPGVSNKASRYLAGWASQTRSTAKHPQGRRPLGSPNRPHWEPRTLFGAFSLRNQTQITLHVTQRRGSGSDTSGQKSRELYFLYYKTYLGHYIL